MVFDSPFLAWPLLVLFFAAQILYLLTFLLDFYLNSLPVNWVDQSEPLPAEESEFPYIVLFYPVLRELEETMRTTFVALGELRYPKSRYKVVAIPNWNDAETIASLKRLQQDFPFVELVETPPTTDPSWDLVWNNWEANPKAYWWHQGKRAKVRDLPPKKTRQLIYSFYHVAEAMKDEPNLVIDYIDADSAPPIDHFEAAAQGLRHYDVLQAQNVAGNLNDTQAAAWHAFDHMAWDGGKYPHLTANGVQPFWVLGKGLFFKAKDLLELGGFHPWITIEDPEVGMRFWKNGRKLGVIRSSLIEEVPDTLAKGVTQRKRWVAGFFQSLDAPLHYMEFTFWERVRAWMIFLPCLSMWINAIGVPTGVWAAWAYFTGRHVVPEWAVFLAILNITLWIVSMSILYARTWKRTALVLDTWRGRVWYMIRVNPLSVMFWWVFWIIPLAIGYWMYRKDLGLVWQRTEKIDANNSLVRERLVKS